MDGTRDDASENEAAVARVDDLLTQAQRMMADPELKPVHTRDELLAIIKECRLEKLDRHPQLQALYVDEFFPAVKAAYGSTEAFLMQRLDWNADTVQNARMSGQMFARDISSDWVRVARNDWAYGAPRDFVHWLVWTALPLVSWPQASDFVARQGLAGAVNLEDPGQDIAAQGNHTEPVCQEIIAFARARWPEAKELVWLVNPVHLQTVPRLAHAHVFVRT